MKPWWGSQVGVLLLATSGCYMGVQRTMIVAKTDAVDPAGGEPSSDLSISSDNIEWTIGREIKDVELFMGFGGGIDQWHQRNRSAASTDDAVSTGTRVTLGASYPLTRFDIFELRALGVYAPYMGSTGGGLVVIDGASIDSSMELGIEVSTRSPAYDPVLRIGVSRISGTAAPMLYEDGEGGTSFATLGIFATMGINLNIFEAYKVFDD